MKRARAQVGRLKRIAMVGAFGAVLAVGGGVAASSPAVAAEVTGQLKNQQTKRCLDANHQGNVYMRPCEVNNLHQTWTIFSADLTADDGYGRFRIKNRATNQCLIMWSDSYPHGHLATDARCGDAIWNNETALLDAVGTSFNNMAIRAKHPRTGNQPFCLGGTYERAYAQVCNGSTSQKWARTTRG
ncbi:RICIN domain-containing protein [Streptomyces sp. NPDC020681]|uniref:RICIN domain-containing protein n=1 Tax=Streptomyces sp. NPDC020681 TaxID=3365083 RepID=UPI003788FD0D